MDALANWAGSVTYRARRLAHPTTVAELQELVATSESIHAVGSRHSFSRVADTTGTLVSVERLPGGMEFDEQAGTVTVPAGARYGDLAPALHQHGRALANLGSLPHLSVAGAVATGTHGSGVGNRCLSAAVVGVELVGADGELITLTAADAELGGAVVALGALGIVTRLTLATRPAFDVRQRAWVDAALAGVLPRLDEILSSAYSVSLFRGPGRAATVDQIWVKSRADEVVPDGTAWGARAATAPMHPIAGQDARAATEQLGRAVPWFAGLPHFRSDSTPSAGDEQQTEYLVAREDGPAAVAAACELDLSEALQVMEVRAVAADDLWLSPATGRDSVALHFTWHNRDAVVGPAVALVETALADFEPRAHWGKVFGLDAGTVRRSYPRLGEFAALAARYDPDRKFGNAFLETYVY